MSEILRKLVGVFEFKDKASKDIDAIKNRMDEGKKSAENLQKVIVGLGGAALIAGFASVAKESLQLAAQFEQTTVQFNTMLGSADKAKEVLYELDKFSLSTPFEPDQVTKAGKTLLAFGFQTENLTKTLRTVGDVSAGTGKDFNELISIFGKARASGKVMTEDLNQLVDAGIPIGSELAKNMSVAESSIRDMASSGKIGFKDLQKAFETMSGEGGRFEDMMKKQSLTAKGMMSTLKGYRDTALRAFGEQILEIIKPVMGWMIENIDAVKAGLKALIPVIGVLLVAALLAAAKAALLFMLPFLPFGLIGAAVAAAIVAITLAVQDLITFFKGGESFTAEILNIDPKTFKESVKMIKDFIKRIQKFFEKFHDSIRKIMDDIGRWFGDTFDSIAHRVQSVIDWFRRFHDRIGQAINGVLEFFKDIPGRIKEFVKSAAEWLKNSKIGKVFMQLIPKMEAREQGGDVVRGQQYLVGESGPELFVPDQSGQIVSNDSLSNSTGSMTPSMQSMGSMVGNLNITVNATGGASPDTIADKVRESVLDALNELSRNIFRAEMGLEVT